MTITQHTYRAFLVQAGGDVELRVKGGRIVLSDDWAPHVQAELRIAPPASATRALLDPRLNPRIRVTADAVTGAGPQSRTFNLGLRVQSASLVDADLPLQLASDEALLGDWAPLADDTTPLSYQGSIRALVNYVLGKVIPGAALQPGVDAPIKALAPAVNLVPNPRAGLGLTDWSASSGSVFRQSSGGPAGAPTYVSVQSSGGGIIVDYARTNLNFQPNTTYRLSAYMSGPVPATLDALIYDGAGTVLLDVQEPPAQLMSQWTQRSVTFTTPPGAARAQLRFFTTQAVPSLQYFNVTGVRLTELPVDPTDTSYFDGDTIDTAEYVYTWQAGGHSSPSLRTVATAAPDPDALVWDAGQNALTYLLTLLQPKGLRLVCDEARLWTLRDALYSAPGSLSVRRGVNLIDGDDEVSRDAGQWYDAAVIRYRWTDGDGQAQERVDAYAAATPYTRATVLDVDSAYPGPGLAQYMVKRAKGRGHDVTVRLVADWRVRAEQVVTARLELDGPVLTGRASRVDFDLDTDELTVTTRAVETVAGAIDLLPGVINSLPGVINSLT